MNPFILISVVFFIVLGLEKLFPNRTLPYKKGWITRAILFNILQLVIVLVSDYIWSSIFNNSSLFKLKWSPFYNGLFAYVINTWIFYWWHFLRHENNFLWLTFHQFHHSPERLELLTSFYKHPFEIIINSCIIAVLTGPILGLDIQTNAWLTIFSAFGEFFYHMNIETPYWLGYIIQRPESHLIHHLRDKQFVKNHGDLPIWDMLGGTFENPKESKSIKTGFSKGRENKILQMLKCKNVLTERKKSLPKNIYKCGIITLLLLLGSMNMIGYIFDSNNMKNIAYISTSSPLPFVFTSYNDVETFSLHHELNLEYKNGTNSAILLDHKLYSKLKGPYNRRNVIGAAFSHGAFFTDKRMLEIRDQIFYWGFCEGQLLDEFGIDKGLNKVTINIKSKNKVWRIPIPC